MEAITTDHMTQMLAHLSRTSHACAPRADSFYHIDVWLLKTKKWLKAWAFKIDETDKLQIPALLLTRSMCFCKSLETQSPSI